MRDWGLGSRRAASIADGIPGNQACGRSKQVTGAMGALVASPMAALQHPGAAVVAVLQDVDPGLGICSMLDWAGHLPDALS